MEIMRSEVSFHMIRHGKGVATAHYRPMHTYRPRSANTVLFCCP